MALLTPFRSGSHEIRRNELAEGQTGTGKPPQELKTEAAFDLWLKRGLHKLFDQVVNEPIPEELRRMIEEDRRK